MSAIFDQAHAGLSGIFETLRSEVRRIENLDQLTQSKQREVDNLTQRETDLAQRVDKAQKTLDGLNAAIQQKMLEHDQAKSALTALKESARKIAGGA